MKARWILFASLLPTFAWALEPGHYTRRCDDLTIVQYYKGATTEKDGEPYGMIGRLELELDVTKDGEYQLTHSKGTFYAAADKDVPHPYPEDTARTKTVVEGNLEREIYYAPADKDGHVSTYESVYRIEEDDSRTLLRTIRDGKPTEAKGVHTKFKATDGREVSVDITSGFSDVDPDGRRWENVSQKDICVTTPKK